MKAFRHGADFAVDPRTPDDSCVGAGAVSHWLREMTRRQPLGTLTFDIAFLNRYVWMSAWREMKPDDGAI